MNPERWQQIETLYHEAHERAPHERTAFLEEACGADVELRREVEKLLQAGDASWSFIEGNAVEQATHRLMADGRSETKAPLVPKQQLGVYRILAPLGKGGMGRKCSTMRQTAS